MRGVFRAFLFQGFLYGRLGSLLYVAFSADPYFCRHGVYGQFIFSFPPPSLMPAAFAVGPGYRDHLRLSEGGLGFVARPLWIGKEDPVVCCGESRDRFCFFLVVEARPIYDRWLWSRDFFSPNSFLSSSNVFEEGWDGKDCIPLLFGGLEDSF